MKTKVVWLGAVLLTVGTIFRDLPDTGITFVDVTLKSTGFTLIVVGGLFLRRAFSSHKP